MAPVEEIEEHSRPSTGTLDEEDIETIVDESAPLLPGAGTEPLLYRTISVSKWTLAEPIGYAKLSFAERNWCRRSSS